MTEETTLEQVSPLALPASRKPARPRHPTRSPKKANGMQTGQKETIVIPDLPSDSYTNGTAEMAVSRETAMLWNRIDNLSDQIQSLHTQLLVSTMLVSNLQEAEHTVSPVQRRRTQDEMLHALHLLSSGEPRPRDDESPQVLEDAIYEVATLRQIVADLMQSATTMYQNGLQSIRKMTER